MIEAALTLDQAGADGPQFAVDASSIDPAVFGLTSYAAPTAPAPRIDRRSAIQVPAVKRCRDLVAGTLGGLPLDLIGPDHTPVVRNLFEQPERGTARSVSMARLFEDLLFEGVAWWKITEFGWHGYPDWVKRVDPRKVTINDSATCWRTDCSGSVFMDGTHVHDAEVIRFDSPSDGLLVAGARAIRTCLALDAAAQRHADGAPPIDYFTPAEDADPDEDDVVAILDSWQTARQTRSTGYVPSALKYNIGGWSPEQLQMADARQHAVLEIARVAGVDAEDLGVSTTSRTYYNAFDKRKGFVDFTLGGYRQAVEDRLSMGDVTPRGYVAKFNLDAFLRSDPLLRMQTYAAALEVGAITKEEIRVLEDRPPMPENTPQQPQQTAAALALPAPAQSFDASPPTSFDAPTGEVFSVDVEKRVIRGLAVPYGVVGEKAGNRFTFAKGTIDTSTPSRVKLWVNHDKAQAVGVAFELDDRDDGLHAAFKVARGAEGDKALSMAEDGVWDGLSIGPSERARYVAKDGVFHSVEIPLTEISLTPAPVFAGARVQSVNFDADQRGNTTMPCDKCGKVHAEGVAECQTGQSFDQPSGGADFSALTDAISKGFENLQFPQREVVPAGGPLEVNEPSPYRFDGVAGEHSFSQDIRDAYMSGDQEARQRLETFMEEAFAVTTTNVGTLNPTQNRPDLYVPNLSFSRPLWDLVSTGTLTDKTPFTVPKFSSASGLVGDHTEGVEPTPGAFAATSQTVSPAPLSGKIEINREVWDQGGSPQADGIIFGEMLNGWYEAIEAKIADRLKTTATAELNLGSVVDQPLAAALTNYLAGLQFARGGNRFTAFAADGKLFPALVAAKDGNNRPLFPVLAPANAQGSVGSGFDSIQIGNMTVRAAWALAQGTNTMSFNFVPSSVWAWASAPKKFTFEYQVKSIDMAIWGYCGTAILRDSDVKPIDYDVSDA